MPGVHGKGGRSKANDGVVTELHECLAAEFIRNGGNQSGAVRL